MYDPDAPWNNIGCRDDWEYYTQTGQYAPITERNTKMFEPNDQDDPCMDAERHIGDWVSVEDGTSGHITTIGSSRTSYDYIIRTEDGSSIQISDEEIVEAGGEEKMNPTEGLDGYHNAIGGYSCPACHDQGGCSQCSATYMYD